MRLLVLVTLLVYIFSSSGEKARFDNYRVYSIKIDDSRQLEVLQELENYQDGILFLEAPAQSHNTAEIVVPPHKFADLTELFDKYNMKTEIKIPNLQR